MFNAIRIFIQDFLHSLEISTFKCHKHMHKKKQCMHVNTFTLKEQGSESSTVHRCGGEKHQCLAPCHVSCRSQILHTPTCCLSSQNKTSEGNMKYVDYEHRCTDSSHKAARWGSKWGTFSPFWHQTERGWRVRTGSVVGRMLKAEHQFSNNINFNR